MLVLGDGGLRCEELAGLQRVDFVAARKGLIAALEAGYPDGWALSTSAAALRDVLAICPASTRVCAWRRRTRPTSSRRALSAWEPLLVVGGRELATDVPQDLLDVLDYRGRYDKLSGSADRHEAAGVRGLDVQTARRTRRRRARRRLPGLRRDRPRLDAVHGQRGLDERAGRVLARARRSRRDASPGIRGTRPALRPRSVPQAWPEKRRSGRPARPWPDGTAGPPHPPPAQGSGPSRSAAQRCAVGRGLRERGTSGLRVSNPRPLSARSLLAADRGRTAPLLANAPHPSVTDAVLAVAPPPSSGGVGGLQEPQVAVR